MATGAVYSSSGYNFGSLESIRKQAKEIGDRVKKQSDARKAEQEQTGLIRNKKGDMVEISSLTDKQVEDLNNWNDSQLVSPYEVMIGFMAADPHAEEIEENKKLAAKYEKIQNKMLAGKKLKPEEKNFLREHYPELAAKAEQMEQEAEQLEKKLRSAKSDKDAQKIYMDAKLNVMSGVDEKDGSVLFLMAALDEVYYKHTGKKNPSAQMTDILA